MECSAVVVRDDSCLVEEAKRRGNVGLRYGPLRMAAFKDERATISYCKRTATEGAGNDLRSLCERIALGV